MTLLESAKHATIYSIAITTTGAALMMASSFVVPKIAEPLIDKAIQRYIVEERNERVAADSTLANEIGYLRSDIRDLTAAMRERR